MDQHSIFEGLSRSEDSARDSEQRGWPETSSETNQGEIRFPGEDGGKSLAEIAHRDLEAALQLLAAQARYITGATGAAIALRDQEEMLCRASAGHSAPEVGSQLQVNSGLSGESVRTRETLRCDDAATDPRVNRESCEALGIASVVVMPLVHGDEVIGVFELFSDKTNAFGTRDLVALERMGKMVFTALGHKEVHDPVVEPTPQSLEAQTPVENQVLPAPAANNGSTEMPLNDSGNVANASTAVSEPPVLPAPADTGVNHEEQESVLELPAAFSGIAFHGNGSKEATSAASMSDAKSETFEPPDDEDILSDAPQVMGMAQTVSTGTHEGQGGVREEAGVASPEILEDVSVKVADASQAPASRSLVAGLRRCEACGFPISEGRQLCLDCEKKKGHPAAPAANETVAFTTKSEESGLTNAAAAPSVIAGPDQIPALFSDRSSDEMSWMSSHKYMIVAVAIALLLIVLFLLAR
jgi:putative methionine-R-sulfoxide reductase with GAF domain